MAYNRSLTSRLLSRGREFFILTIRFSLTFHRKPSVKVFVFVNHHCAATFPLHRLLIVNNCVILPHRSRRQGSWVGDDIMEKRLLSACFDVWKSGSFNNLVKNKATVDAHGCVVPNNHRICALAQVQFECFTYRRGLRRCSFRQDGRCQSLYTWDE